MIIRQCLHCKQALSLIEHARDLYCQKPLCQRTKMQKYLTENKKNLTAELLSQLKEHLPSPPVQNSSSDNHKEQNETAPVVALLPANTNHLVHLNNTRKRQFLQHLGVIYTDVKRHNPTSNRVYSEQLDPPLPENVAQLVGKACATCLGSCCKHGQTHAFMDYPSVKHLLETQLTNLSEQEILNLYWDYLPEKSYEYSCVFQADQGCALPKELRSFTCNNFLCEEVIAFSHSIKHADSSLTFAAAVDNNNIMFTSVFDDKRFIRVKEKQS